MSRDNRAAREPAESAALPTQGVSASAWLSGGRLGRRRLRFAFASLVVGALLLAGCGSAASTVAPASSTLPIATSPAAPTVTVIAAASPSAVAAAPSVAPSGAPSISPIQAVFTDSLYHTVYTESATGTGLTYAWTVSMSADPHCAVGFKGNAPSANQATWYHADITSSGGPCDHTYYGAQGHPGTVTVVVTDALWRCSATYVGTLTGTGPAPAACVSR